MGLDVIAAILEQLAREAFVDGFDLLQNGDVGLRFVEPLGQGVDPRFDPVDVERGDFHGGPLHWSPQLSRIPQYGARGLHRFGHVSPAIRR